MNFYIVVECICSHSSYTVTKFSKFRRKMEIFQPETIVKCFKCCGIPPNPTIVEEFTELDDVQLDPEIGDMPWDECIQWENQ